MIVCPNCNHTNPEGATQCEACYTPLPTLAKCPSCGAAIQSNATFCGQCGFQLISPGGDDEAESLPPTINSSETSVGETETEEEESFLSSSTSPIPEIPSSVPSTPILSTIPSMGSAVETPTQLQLQLARLLHIQTQTHLELSSHLSVIHIGKPNERIPPDIDVSGFPDSDVVSRIHADIRVEGDAFYIEDTGSSNGTYINHTPLLPGNRHRLRSGDRISLGKGDKVSFLFQLVNP